MESGELQRDRGRRKGDFELYIEYIHTFTYMFNGSLLRKGEEAHIFLELLGDYLRPMTALMTMPPPMATPRPPMATPKIFAEVTAPLDMTRAPFSTWTPSASAAFWPPKKSGQHL